MRKLFPAIALFALIAGLASAADFGYPTAGEPWYSIKLGFQAAPAALGAGNWTLIRITVNGQRARNFALLQGGRETTAPEIDAAKPFELKVRWSWEARQAYEIKADFEGGAGKTVKTLTAKEKAPSGKGYWNSAWKNYLSLLVSEDDGLERTRMPVHATFGVLSSYLKSADEIRVVRAERKGDDVVYEEVPFQVYDVRTWNDPKITAQVDKDEKTGKTTVRYHPTTSFSLAFLTDLKPRQKATYLVFYNNPGARRPAFKSDLKVSGQGLGKTIENAFYKVVLHPKSGTIYEVVEKSSAVKLEHKLETNGSVHWNPDVYAPPHAWYHVSDWDKPAYSEDSGPVFYSLRREAPLPMPKGIKVAVTYYFYAGAPFILAESAMTIENDIFVESLRNAEIVFNKAVFNKAAWRGVDGKLTTLDFASSRMHPKHAARIRTDVPWIAFYSDSRGLGFASLFLDQALPNLHGGSASQEQPHIYIEHGPWYYMSRGIVDSFGSNNQTRLLAVKAGSLYYERNAWLPFAFAKEQGFAGRLDALYGMLKHPVGLAEDIETYLESPEGWIVPILTEPFEEGVKGAIGAPKKK
ncbi:MAG: hypothetical protein NTZ26_06385 [Candidatus Aminicenantes bacterium]|nr:hypothetical protein [Candidatus Aminicenantes bacterium]